MNILVTGGAGYIGSHMVRLLLNEGHTPVVLDTLEFGHQAALPSKVKLVVGNVGDENLLQNLFSATKFDAVIHFAGYIQVGESVSDPAKYFTNNLVRPTTLLNTMVKFGIKSLIFSSTAAVYGQPQKVPIPETTPKLPTNPYGLSKLCFEQLLQYFDRSFGLHSIALRYFNACGASLDGKFGEDHTLETHIIPLAIKAALTRQEFTLFGNDYPTPDHTCIRDYIHLEDLCSAHLATLDALNKGYPTDIFNVGTGNGHSNLEVLATVQKIAGEFPVTIKPQRLGDPAELVADSQKLKDQLGWKPLHSDLNSIISTAFMWHKGHPNGYVK